MLDFGEFSFGPDIIIFCMPVLLHIILIFCFPQVGYNVLDLGKDKKWLEEEKEAEDLRRSGKQKSKHHPAKATIAEKCPECGTEKMYFWTRQLRSADEGQTVFFECTNDMCGHRFCTNS